MNMNTILFRLIFCITAILLMHESIVDENAWYILEQCGRFFLQMNFDIFNYEEYNTYFDNSSTLILTQAGVYTGPDNIKEYVYFPDENSQYI